MFQVGDVVEMFAPTAGKKKYHLCVCCANSDGVEKFLFINSGDGYAGDFVLADGDIDGLPPSPTGKSVISCAMVVRQSSSQLSLYKARKLSELKVGIARRLATFIGGSTVLPKAARAEIAENLNDFKRK